jgi:hypothetical protein
MTARERERALYAFCAAVARGHAVPATAEEGQYVLLAAALLGDRPEAARLQSAGEAFFSYRVEQRISLQEVVRQGLVRDLPRFRDGVEAALSDGAGMS